MPKFQLQYTSVDGAVRRATYRADDAACAVGILFDERDDLDARHPVTVAPFGRLVALSAPAPADRAQAAPKRARRPKAKAKRVATPALPKVAPYDAAAMAAPQTREDVRDLLDFLASEVRS